MIKVGVHGTIVGIMIGISMVMWPGVIGISIAVGIFIAGFFHAKSIKLF